MALCARYYVVCLVCSEHLWNPRRACSAAGTHEAGRPLANASGRTFSQTSKDAGLERRERTNLPAPWGGADGGRKTKQHKPSSRERPSNPPVLLSGLARMASGPPLRGKKNKTTPAKSARAGQSSGRRGGADGGILRFDNGTRKYLSLSRTRRGRCRLGKG